MLSFDGFSPLAERYDAGSGLWCTEHARDDGSRFVIARPYADTVSFTAAGASKAEAIANWQHRVAPSFSQRLAA